MKIEVIYLMNIVKYFDNLNTLQRFMKVSSHCVEAIDRTKINPCCGLNSIEAALQNSRFETITREQKIFPNLETLAIDYHSLINKDIYSLAPIERFNIYKYVMMNSKDDYQIISEIAERIVSIGVDTTYHFDPQFNLMKNIQTLTIRIRESSSLQVIQSLFACINSYRYLRSLTIHLDSSQVSTIRQMTDQLKDDIQITYIIDWLYKENLNEVGKLLSGKYNVGITMINMDQFLDIYIDKNVILIPFINDNFQISSEMMVDKRIYEILQQYYPYKLEIQGGSRKEVVIEKGMIFDFSGLCHLEELFLNDTCFTEKIIIKIPSSLKRLTITKTESIESIEGLLCSQLSPTTIEKFINLSNEK